MFVRTSSRARLRLPCIAPLIGAVLSVSVISRPPLSVVHPAVPCQFHTFPAHDHFAHAKAMVKSKCAKSPNQRQVHQHIFATRISDSPDAGWDFVLMVLPNIYGSIIAIFSHTSYL